MHDDVSDGSCTLRNNTFLSLETRVKVFQVISTFVIFAVLDFLRLAVVFLTRCCIDCKERNEKLGQKGRGLGHVTYF